MRRAGRGGSQRSASPDRTSRLRLEFHLVSRPSSSDLMSVTRAVPEQLGTTRRSWFMKHRTPPDGGDGGGVGVVRFRPLTLSCGHDRLKLAERTWFSFGVEAEQETVKRPTKLGMSLVPHARVPTARNVRDFARN